MQILSVVVVALVGLLSCEAATIYDYISSHNFGDLVRTAGLQDELTNGGPYTLFIASDLYLSRYLESKHTTLAQLKADPVALKEMLLFHIVNGAYAISDLYNEQKLPTLNGGTIRVNDYGLNRVMIQGVRMQSREYHATNGYIHYLYGPIEAANGTVADIVASQSDLSQCLAAVKAAGLEEFLMVQNPITLFAPTDSAFAALGSKMTTLTENPALLAEVLKYHVVYGTVYSAIAGLTGDLHTFEEEDKIHIQNAFGRPLSGTGSMVVDNAHTVKTGVDMSAFNGVVHKIDHVLIPKSLADQL